MGEALVAGLSLVAVAIILNVALCLLHHHVKDWRDLVCWRKLP